MIAIAGAGGGLGRRIAEYVIDGGRTEVVLITRKPDGLEDLRRRGAVVRHGDTDDAASFDVALVGVTRMLLVSAPGHLNETRLRRHGTALEAAGRAGVDHVIYTSAVCATHEDSSMLFPSHRGTEDQLKRAARTWTILRNSLYADFILDRCRWSKATGRYVSNAGDGRAAYVTRDDCAAVAAAVLTSDGHAGRTYDVTGPAPVGDDEVVELANRELGLALDRTSVGDAGAAADYCAMGLERDAAEVYASFLAGVRIGAYETCSSVVSDLAGRPPTSLAAFFATVAGTTS